MRTIEVIPGILSKTLDDYKEKLALATSLSNHIHVDLADGRVVANRTISLPQILSVPTEARVALHMMVDSPKDYIEMIPDNSPIDELIIHLDWEDQPYVVIDAAHERDLKVSMAISPAVPEGAGVAELAAYIPMLHSVLVMGIVPGFSGQQFREETLRTMVHLHKEFPDLSIAVDGGMKPATAKLAVQAGASIIYATSYLNRAADPQQALVELAGIT